MDPLTKKVALRHVAAAKDVEQLLLEDLDPDKIEIYLQGLVDSIEGVDEVEKELGLDVRNLVKLLDKYPHNDDIHHSGETTLEHMRWVLEDVKEIAKDKDETTRHMMQLVALLHDLGKAYTYKRIDDKHTFRRHADISVKLAEKMLAKLQKKNAKLYQRIIEVVREHDLFMRLIDAQKNSGGKRKYLNKFMRSTVYTEGHLDDLVTFSMADGNRSQRMQDTLDGMEAVLADLKAVEKERRDEEARRKRVDTPSPEVIEAARVILEQEAPELVELLPNLKAIKGQLGKAKRYDVLQQLGKIQ